MVRSLDRYPLTELTSRSYSARTEKNVVESDGTLILMTGGTKLTAECARKHGRLFLIVQLDDEPRTETVIQWLESNVIKALNVAGPRESKTHQGIYHRAASFLKLIFAELQKSVGLK